MVMNALNRLPLAEWEFIEAEDGQDALEKFDPKVVDLILADWNMPRMSGVEFAQKVRSNKKNAHIPIVMITSEQTVGKMNEALGRAGANAYICKPFNDQELERKLAKLIAGIPEKSEKSSGFFGRLVGG